MSKIFIEESTLTAIGDAIREKEGTTELVPVTDMATRITAIQSGGADLPEEAFNITGNCQYRFSNGSWDWFIENYGNRVTTSALHSPIYIFMNSTVSKIPFDLNFSKMSGYDASYMFQFCANLTEVPKITGCYPNKAQNLFQGCTKLRTIPDDYNDGFNWDYITSTTSAYSGHKNGMFNNCYSLRSFPMKLLEEANPNNISYTSSIYNQAFSNCHTLDEIVNLPFPHTNVTWTANAFTQTIINCHRLKTFTFALQEDGTPYAVRWKSQMLDFRGSNGLGWCNSSETNILGYNSGITADKKVTDDASYQALKNDPDWYTLDVHYSRYNHDSAVATINSLPDTSAYLATQSSGTNTIYFRGEAGLYTDGGAINTLTEEEIAVATAKGWTVTLS